MTAILVIDDEPLICEVLSDYLQDEVDTTVQVAHNSTDAARLLKGNTYDLAIIEASLPGISGLDLAELAANGNTSVLLITANLQSKFQLHQFNYPYLAKPFTLDALRVAAARIMSEHGKNRARIKTSAARMLANREALRVAMVQSDRLLDASRQLLQFARWDATIARLSRKVMAVE
jgi:DNA-binding NtrC family response regulator